MLTLQEKEQGMKKITILLFWTCSFTLMAQTNMYEKVDEKIAQHSSLFDKNAISALAAFINTNFSDETDKLRAVFTWTTNNFEYDVENMFTIKSYNDPQEIIAEMLKNRKGICMHFAYLFAEITNQLGIKTYVTAGYTKQNGIIDNIPHVWNASLIDTVWYLIDPTWGAGYVQNQKFVKRQNNDYFKANPTDLIRSHMPFDPLWQFLNYPISAQEFYDSRTEINKEKSFFDYAAILKAHENMSKIEQLVSANRRIEQNGVRNALIRNHLQDNLKEIMINRYNSAVYLFNDGIEQLNEFIYFRNRQFTPEKTEMEIREMTKISENLLISSRNELQKILTADPNLMNMTNQLRNSVNEAIKQIEEQNEFINKYFNTRKVFRKSLF